MRFLIFLTEPPIGVAPNAVLPSMRLVIAASISASKSVSCGALIVCSKPAGSASDPSMQHIGEIHILCGHSIRLDNLHQLAIAVEVWLLLARHDEGRRFHRCSKLVFCLSLIEIFSNKHRRMCPYTGLALGMVLGHLSNNPTSPAEANGTYFFNAILFEMQVNMLEYARTMLPIEPAKPFETRGHFL